MRSALIVWGGWDGHEPEGVAHLFRELLEAEEFAVTVSPTLDAFKEHDLTALSLIVPIWTMGTIAPDQRDPVLSAVRDHGVGLAGCHGGMCDAFRTDTEWQFMTGGQWVAHPGNDNVRYTVEIVPGLDHPVTAGLADFEVESEQYYLHTDPANTVLATTRFPNPTLPAEVNVPVEPCAMPQVWVRRYGRGRVFYSALGHQRRVVESGVPRELLRRGCVWAAR